MSSSKRVLVVDDFFETLYYLKSILELTHEDLRVVGVPSAEEGILELRQTTYDLLITDVRLPGIDGFDLIRRVRRVLPDLPIIVMTAYTSDDARRDAEALGVRDYLRKPLDTDALLTAVAGALGVAPQAPPPEAVETLLVEEPGVLGSAEAVPDEPVAATPPEPADAALPATDEPSPSTIDAAPAAQPPAPDLAGTLAALCADTGAAQATFFGLDGTLLTNTREDEGGKMPALTRAIADILRRGRLLAQHMGNAQPMAAQLHENGSRALFTTTVDNGHGLALFFSKGARRRLEELERLVEDHRPALRAALDGQQDAPADEPPLTSVQTDPPPDLAWLADDLAAAPAPDDELESFWSEALASAGIEAEPSGSGISWDEAEAQGLIDPDGLGEPLESVEA